MASCVNFWTLLKAPSIVCAVRFLSSGEGLTQQELCDACVSLILRSDDHIIDGGVANNGLAYDDPDRSEQPRPLKGGRVLGNVQDRGDFACLAEGACDFLGLGGWGGGARNWGAGKTALMLCPAQNVRGDDRGRYQSWCVSPPPLPSPCGGRVACSPLDFCPRDRKMSFFFHLVEELLLALSSSGC